ncbi:unnamed protein product [Euphydryas editha]|uniref:Uncharacterized protein n=1 Tax=Euphydryas editha TaxID=104508 RepID=A0AAU9U6I0_EUPED|nr:unnamed protein product [Euphydryas editha]
MIFKPRPRWFKERANYFLDLDDHDFVLRFHLSKNAALTLLAKIEHHLEYPTDSRVSHIPGSQSVLNQSVGLSVCGALATLACSPQRRRTATSRHTLPLNLIFTSLSSY